MSTEGAENAQKMAVRSMLKLEESAVPTEGAKTAQKMVVRSRL